MQLLRELLRLLLLLQHVLLLLERLPDLWILGTQSWRLRGTTILAKLSRGLLRCNYRNRVGRQKFVLLERYCRSVQCNVTRLSFLLHGRCGGVTHWVACVLLQDRSILRRCGSLTSLLLHLITRVLFHHIIAWGGLMRLESCTHRRADFLRVNLL